MDWYLILYTAVIFYCGYKLGKTAALWYLAVGVSKLSTEDQEKFKKLLNRMGVI